MGSILIFRKFFGIILEPIPKLPQLSGKSKTLFIIISHMIGYGGSRSLSATKHLTTSYHVSELKTAAVFIYV